MHLVLLGITALRPYSSLQDFSEAPSRHGLRSGLTFNMLSYFITFKLIYIDMDMLLGISISGLPNSLSVTYMYSRLESIYNFLIAAAVRD